MKTIKQLMVLVSVLAVVMSLPMAHAIRVTSDEARRVAENYIKLTIAKDGSWGGHETARVTSIEPFRQGDQLLGYYCPVEPVGYFILGLYRELAPIRAYSVRSNLDPSQTEGPAAFHRDRVAALYRGIESSMGRSIDPAEDFSSILPAEFRAAWDVLGDPRFDATPYVQDRPQRAGAGIDYQEGEELLRTTWWQGPPFNDQCPDGGCDWSQYGDFNTNKLVGCAGTAGGQIMAYWHWPPYGEGSLYEDSYDWSNMIEKVAWDSTGQQFYAWKAGTWTPITQAQVDAVAEVSYEYAKAIESSFGCDETSAYFSECDNAFEDHLRYWDHSSNHRAEDYSFMDYWIILREEFNYNRPVFYYIPNHFIVGDGWKEEWIDHPDYGLEYYWMHIVYGWGGTHDGWCPPQEIPDSNWNEEGFLKNNAPEGMIGSILDENYPLEPSFPYRYFYRDVEWPSGNFEAGHMLQFLGSGLLMTSVPAGPDFNIVFNGAPGAETLFYLYGDPVGESRIRIEDGQIVLHDGGQLAVF